MGGRKGRKGQKAGGAHACQGGAAAMGQARQQGARGAERGATGGPGSRLVGGPQGGQGSERGEKRGAGAPLPLGRRRRGPVLASRGWSRGARVLIGVERGRMPCVGGAA